MIYTVRIRVRSARADEWETWMREHHMPNVMRTGCFSRSMLTRDPASDSEEYRSYRTFYETPDEDAMERYRAEHAALLQQEHLELFAGDFEASRETLDIIETFPGNDS